MRISCQLLPIESGRYRKIPRDCTSRLLVTLVFLCVFLDRLISISNSLMFLNCKALMHVLGACAYIGCLR